MPIPLPHLDLSHGQVAWCLAGGKEPKKLLLDQLGYLRQLHIPFEEEELGQGRGVRVRYDFNHFMEVGIAYEGLLRRIEPRLLLMLRDQREQYRNVYRVAYAELIVHPSYFEGEPGRYDLIDGDFVIRFNDRYSTTPGVIQIEPAPDPGQDSPRDVMAQLYGPEQVPLKSLMARLLRFAMIAPKTKPGPKR